MPAVLRIDGVRIAIYPNDHPPAHVHVIGPGWTMVIDLVELDVREVIGCDQRHANRILRTVAGHRETLMNAWRRFHG